MTFDELPRNHFGAILADPPWNFVTRWAQARTTGSNGGGDRRPKYEIMSTTSVCEMPVGELAAPDCVLFLWGCWPNLCGALRVIEAWGFTYKTCAFCWTKANARQIDLFREDVDGHIGLGYWTRANSEPCLLATCGNPKRQSAGVRQAIIEPRREHSRKPDCVHERIERLVAGPYLELFARQSRPGWTTWGNEATKFDPPKRDSWGDMWKRPLFDDDAGNLMTEGEWKKGSGRMMRPYTDDE